MGIRKFCLNSPRELGGAIFSDDGPGGNTRQVSNKYAEAPACGGVVVPGRVISSMAQMLNQNMYSWAHE